MLGFQLLNGHVARDDLVLEDIKHDGKDEDEGENRHVDIAKHFLLFFSFHHHPRFRLAGLSAVLQELRTGKFQMLDQFIVGLVAIVGILLQRAIDHVGSGAGDIRRECLQADDMALEMLQGHQRRVFRFERRPPRQRMEERAAKAVHVAPEIFRVMIQFFGRHVIGRSPDLILRFLRLLQRHRETKVHDLRRVRVREKNIAGLHVAVNQPGLNCGAQPHRRLDADLQHLDFRDSPLQVHEVVKGAFVHQLHGDVILAVVAPEREDLHDIGMIDRRGNLRLGFELLDVFLILAELFPQKLQGDDAVQIDIARPVNGAHPPGRNLLDELKVIVLIADADSGAAAGALDFGKRLLLGNVKGY